MGAVGTPNASFTYQAKRRVHCLLCPGTQDTVLGTLAAELQDFYKRQSEPLQCPDVRCGGSHEGAEENQSRGCSSPEHSCVSVSDPDTEGSGACIEMSTDGGGGGGGGGRRGGGREDLNHAIGLLAVSAPLALHELL